MSPIHIIPSEFNKELKLELAYSIKAGFPLSDCSTITHHQGRNIPQPTSGSSWRTFRGRMAQLTSDCKNGPK